MEGKISYQFTASIWQDPGAGGWHFVSLPADISKEIRSSLRWQEEGWGRMKAQIQVGEVIWESAIWFDTKHNTYLLPVKAAVRKQLKLQVNDEVEMLVRI